MANILNLLPAGFGLNKNKFLLTDPAAYIKVLDDTAWTTMRALGYMEIEKTWSQKAEFAKFQAGVPSRTIRNDMVSELFTLEGQLKQLQPEVISLISNKKIDSSVEGETSVLYGSKAPAPLFIAVELVFPTVDGSEVRLCVRCGQMTTEDLSIALGGKEHAKIPFKLEAVVDDDPLGHNPDWRYAGKGTITGGLTADDATVSSVVFGSISDVKIGGHIYGPDGIPTGATVLSVDYIANTIEMSDNASATAAEQTIYVERDCVDAEYDNIAFWRFLD